MYFSQIPAWNHLTAKEYRDHVRELIQQIEEEVRAEGKPVLGAERILAQDPCKEPKSTKKETAPDFHAATKEALQALRYAYREFLAAFRQAADRLRSGEKPSGRRPCVPKKTVGTNLQSPVLVGDTPGRGIIRLKGIQTTAGGRGSARSIGRPCAGPGR